MGAKYYLLRLSLLSLGAIASLAPAHARDFDNEPGSFFGLRLTTLNPDTERVVVSNNTAYPYHNGFESPGFGLQYGMMWGNQWQLRSYYDRVRMNVAAGHNNVWGHSYGVDAIYRLDSGLYAGVGINNTRTNRQRDPMLRGSLGFQVALLDRFYSSLEYNIQTESDFTDQLITWSINYRLGRSIDKQTLPREFRERRQQRTKQPETSRGNSSPSGDNVMITEDARD